MCKVGAVCNGKMLLNNLNRDVSKPFRSHRRLLSCSSGRVGEDLRAHTHINSKSSLPSSKATNRAALGDGPKLTDPNLRFPALLCKNLRFSARIRWLLRFHARKGGSIGRTPRGSCDSTLLRRVLRRFSRLLSRRF